MQRPRDDRETKVGKDIIAEVSSHPRQRGQKRREGSTSQLKFLSNIIKAMNRI